MKNYPLKSRFGWPGDRGLGKRLIKKIMSRKKTASAGPKDLYSSKAIKELKDNIGKPITIIDRDGKPHCNIRLLDVYETTFGKPDARLVAGEGYADDIKAFQADHAKAWKDLVTEGRLKLTKNTVLIVEIFELLEE
jgi:uncharacterized protein YhfF